MVTGTLQTKNGMYYAVLSYKDKETEKWKQKWKTTKIEDKKGNKKLAKEKLVEIKTNFEKELIEKEIKQKEETNLYAKRVREYKDKTFLEFIKDSIEEFKNNITETTYDSWVSLSNCRFKNFFSPLSVLDKIMNGDVKRNVYYDKPPKICDITQFDIEDFYKWLFDCGLKGSTVAKYHMLLSLIFKRAVRLKIFTLDTNPMKDIEKPKIVPYTADYYSPQELNTLFEIVKGHTLEIPVILAAYYGMRRSEVLGLKWSAIDFENKYLTVKHTVSKVIGCGENQEIHCKDSTKNKEDRTLPLIEEVEKRLLEHKKKIEENKKFFGDSYVKQTQEYVCVNEIGELIKPNYITHAFRLLLKENSDKIKRIKYHRFEAFCRFYLSSKQHKSSPNPAILGT